ncbi:hypothetical protein DOE76_07235 [Leifsonia sp. ku-ls]|nr:hypothetical protein DOE76_07235 [Leifsonia sp. ku-ls]
MTAAHPAAFPGRTPAAAPGAPARIWRVVRLNVVNKWTVIWLPVMIMFFIGVVNWLIWWIIWSATNPADRADAMDGTQWTGAAFYIFVYMMVVAIQVVSSTFPFALGYSVTRRDFALGSGLTFLLLSAGYAIGFTVLAAVEEWTNGWWLGGHLFTSVYFADETFAGRLFMVFTAMLFFFAVGAFSASLFMRWRMNGILVAGATLALLLVGAIALITYTQSWPAVGEWFVVNGPIGVTAWLLLPTVLAAVAGYAVLGRATPRS